MCDQNFACCLINLDNSDEPGSHFIAMIRYKNTFYVYDSLALNIHYEILEPQLDEFVQRCNLDLWTNKVRHQGLNAKTCGFFCAWFIIKFALKLPKKFTIQKKMFQGFKPTTTMRHNESVIIKEMLEFNKNVNKK